jgi:hypothetical protein
MNKESKNVRKSTSLTMNIRRRMLSYIKRKYLKTTYYHNGIKTKWYRIIVHEKRNPRLVLFPQSSYD